MTRSERRLLLDTGLIGVILTCIVAGLDYGGTLERLEHYFYDLRAQICQFFQPQPTDKLVHLDMDDRTLADVGAWPWPRSKLAEIIDEINLAGAKALDLDVIFPEPQAAGYEEVLADTVAPTTGPTTAESGSAFRAPRFIQARRIDHDAALAAALRRYGKALVPVNLELKLRSSEPELLRPLVAELMRDLELKPAELLSQLQAQGIALSATVGDIDGPLYDAASREAMFQRVSVEMQADPGATTDQLRIRLLPKTGPQITGSLLLRLMENQRNRLEANIALRRFARAIPHNLPPLFASRQESLGIAPLMQAAGFTGFVDYVPMGADGSVRSVPLWASHRNLMYPQMGLALACAMLDVNPKDLRLTPNSVVIPAAGGDIAIPVRTQTTSAGRIGMFFDIPWFGSDNWETMYDYPKHEQSKQHVPVSYVWDACEMRHRIESNNRSIDSVMADVLEAGSSKKLGMDPALAKKYFGSPPKPDDTEARRKLAADYVDLLPQIIDNLKAKAKTPEEHDDVKGYQYSYKLLVECLAQNDRLRPDLNARRVELRSQLSGRAALLGWTAAGAIADVVPTPLHARCPGAVIHGVIFNSIMTRHFWRAAPIWVNILITMVMGLLATAGVALLSPWKAVSGVMLLIAGYLAFNGLYLFDKQSLLVGVAGPVTAAAGVWAAGTLIHYVLELALRRRIHNHFQEYADKKLVRYLLDHDDRLESGVKELTVVFTDLGDFTRISEELGERTVPLLSRYMGLMVPIISSHNGTLNKFIGDGIMFFFGAPYENAVHTVDAIRSVLAMQETMVGFNQSLAQQGLPYLELRAGISSGNMIVGNAGPADRMDYTVLGDVVNLAARLEPANKVFGTRVLVNGRARELAGDDRILFRPIGKLQVVGKKEGVMAHEPLCLMEQADEQKKKLAEMTASIVSAFMAGDFAACLRAIDEFERVFEHGKLTSLYREMSEGYLREPPTEGFDGQIVLTAK